MVNLLHKKCKLGGYIHGQLPKNANVICEGSLIELRVRVKQNAKINIFLEYSL